MKPESEKYKEVINLIRKSNPVLKETDEIENEVIRRVSVERGPGYLLSGISDLIFGWVYIGWVRRSLVTASVALVLYFAWQQGVMMKQIRVLSRQSVMVGNESMSFPSSEIERGINLYRIAGRRLPQRMITISEEKINQLLDSVIVLQTEYKELKKLVLEDPELKKLLEEKLTEKNRAKTKL